MTFEILATRTMKYNVPVEAGSLFEARRRAEELIRSGASKPVSDICACRQAEKSSAAEYAARHWDDVLDLLPEMLRDALFEAEVDVEGDTVVLSFGSMFTAKYASGAKGAIEDALGEIAERYVPVDIRVPFPGTADKDLGIKDEDRGCGRAEEEPSLFNDLYSSASEKGISFEYRPQSGEMRFCDKDKPSVGCSVVIIGTQDADPASAAFESAALEAIRRSADQFRMLLKAFPPMVCGDDASFARRFLLIAEAVDRPDPCCRGCDGVEEEDDW